MRQRREIPFSEKSIGLDNVINARELGGYVMQDGRKIKKGLLLRGGNLSKASENDIRRLKNEYHLAINFDFRSEKEIMLSPDKPMANVEYMWLPTIDEKTAKLGKLNLPGHAYTNLPKYLVEHCFEQKVKEIAANMYPELVKNEYTQLQYAAFLQKIAGVEGERAVYWHCSQGKDRTGLGAALLLAALGADRDTIMEDFAISNSFYKEEIESTCKIIKEMGGSDEEFAVVQTFIGVKCDYFENALNIIDKEYGSMDQYLSDVMVLTDEDKDKMRNRLLE